MQLGEFEGARCRDPRPCAAGGGVSTTLGAPRRSPRDAVARDGRHDDGHDDIALLVLPYRDARVERGVLADELEESPVDELLVAAQRWHHGSARLPNARACGAGGDRTPPFTCPRGR